MFSFLCFFLINSGPISSKLEHSNPCSLKYDCLTNLELQKKTASVNTPKSYPHLSLFQSVIFPQNEKERAALKRKGEEDFFFIFFYFFNVR